MSQITLFYTIQNCGDGSAEALFHEDQEAAQIACEIEEEGGEAFSENYVYTHKIESTEQTTQIELIYTIENCGDGSAAVLFHEDREAAQAACDEQEETGEAFSENQVFIHKFKFDSNGKLLNPSFTKEELKEELTDIKARKLERENARKNPPSPPKKPLL